MFFARLQSKIIIIVGVAFTFLVVAGFNNDSKVLVLAKPLTPEAAAYEIRHADSATSAGQKIQAESEKHKQELREGPKPIPEAAQKATESTGSALQRVADSVREKLNLDEPLPRSTKDFLDSAKDSVK